MVVTKIQKAISSSRWIHRSHFHARKACRCRRRLSAACCSRRSNSMWFIQSLNDLPGDVSICVEVGRSISLSPFSITGQFERFRCQQRPFLRMRPAIIGVRLDVCRAPLAHRDVARLPGLCPAQGKSQSRLEGRPQYLQGLARFPPTHMKPRASPIWNG